MGRILKTVKRGGNNGGIFESRHHQKNMTRYEQETIVTYNNEEKTAEIYTCDPIVIRKLDALVEKYPSCYQMIKETEESKTYSCPKKMIAFRKPVVMSDEQKEKASERLRKYRESEQSTASINSQCQ